MQKKSSGGITRQRMRKQSPTTLRKKLDDVFSAFIRSRDTKDGKGWCITCGVYTELEAGHFIPRQHAATRWLENNVHGQCPRCNRWLHGDQASYYEALVKKYGQDVVSELMRLKKTTRKFSTSEMKEMIARYSNGER